MTALRKFVMELLKLLNAILKPGPLLCRIEGELGT